MSRNQAHLSLQEVSDRLGVHYMTAYRYVRTGRLAATKHDGEWRINVRDLDRLEGRDARRSSRRGQALSAQRLAGFADRLVACDEPGAWGVIEALLTGGSTAPDIYGEVIGPALRLIGDRWATGEIGVADEHAATGVVQRLIGRMGPLFRRRGRPRGILVVGAPESERHALPTALAADLLRARGFVVIDLGANVPTESFIECVGRLPRVRAVGVAITTPGQQQAVRNLIATSRRARLNMPIVVGGAGITETESHDAGADYWTASAPSLVALLTTEL